MQPDTPQRTRGDRPGPLAGGSPAQQEKTLERECCNRRGVTLVKPRYSGARESTLVSRWKAIERHGGTGRVPRIGTGKKLTRPGKRKKRRLGRDGLAGNNPGRIASTGVNEGNRVPRERGK